MEKRREPFSYLFARTWRFSAGNRRAVCLVVILIALANAVYLLVPLVFARFLNEIQAQGITQENFSTLVGILFLFIVLQLVFWAFHGPGRVLENNNAFFVRKQYKEYLLSGLLTLNLSWHNDRDSGDTIDKIEKGTDALFDFSGSIFIYIEIFIRAFGTAGILLYFNQYAGLTLLAFFVVVFFVLTRFDTRLVGQYKALNLFDNRISAKVFDALSNITSVIILRIQSLIMTDIRHNIDAPRPLFRKNILLEETKWFTGTIIFELSVVITMVVFLFHMIDQEAAIAVGTVSALYMYLRNTSEVFFGFANHYGRLLRLQAAVSNAELLAADFTHAAQQPRPGRRVHRSLAIEHLSFSYDGVSATESRQLHDIHCHITAGERIALVGESGSGKTTFLKILHGLYPVESGVVTVDDSRLRKKLHEIDLGTTLVPQEPELFSASILENITLGVDAAEAEINEVLALARFSDVVAQLPHGLESKINERGVNLSGGQKQRLALARALLFAKNKDIILLDESTSSVDPENEIHIYKNIFSHFTRQTIIASIHKFNLLEQFDRIIMFAHGTIVADGSFTQLKRGKTPFAPLWKQYQKSVIGKKPR